MSDHTVPQWKQRLKHAAVAAGVALAGYNTVQLSQPTEAMHHYNGSRVEATTLEAALDRFNVATHYREVRDFSLEGLRAGAYDTFFNVKEKTEAGRLAAVNALNNSELQRAMEATRNDMARVVEITGFSTIEKDSAPVAIAKFAASSVAGAATILTYPRNLVSIKIDDAMQMIKGTDPKSIATARMAEEGELRYQARRNVERIQDELQGQASPQMSALLKQFDSEYARGSVDQKTGRPVFDLVGDNLTENGRKVVHQILSSDEGKQALARAEAKETLDQFLARKDQEYRVAPVQVAKLNPSDLAGGMHRMLGLDKNEPAVLTKKKRSGPG
jgi:hypothetical protein